MKFKISYNKMCKNYRQIFKIEMSKNRHDFIASSRTEAGKENGYEKINSFSAYKQDSILMLDKITKYGCDLCQLREIIQNNVLKW